MRAEKGLSTALNDLFAIKRKDTTQTKEGVCHFSLQKKRPTLETALINKRNKIVSALSAQSKI